MTITLVLAVAGWVAVTVVILSAWYTALTGNRRAAETNRRLADAEHRARILRDIRDLRATRQETTDGR